MRSEGRSTGMLRDLRLIDRTRHGRHPAVHEFQKPPVILRTPGNPE